MTNQPNILIVACQPDEVWLRYNIPLDIERIGLSLGLPKATKRLRAVSAITDSLPTDFPEQGVIICGSRYHVYEDLPWIRAAEKFVRQVYAQGKPMLGLCFGHQLIAKALGGEVRRAQRPEKGMVGVNLTDDCKTDPLFVGLGTELQVATHHNDSVVSLPDIADIRVLGFNANEPYQALAIGDKIRTLAFHPDIRAADIVKMLLVNKDSLLESGYFKNETEFSRQIEQIQRSSIDKSNQKILSNFVSHSSLD